MYLIGIPKLAHCGGEPLLFDGIYDIITYAGQKEIYFSITTNGMKAYQFKENELIILRENNVQKNLSIDSFKENIQELIRGHPKRIKVNRNT